MKKIFPLILVAAVSLSGWFLVNAADSAKAEAAKPLRILLVAGGCCHDYETQKTILKAGIESRINAVVDIEFNPDKSTGATFPIYEKDNWADGYDVILHDECSASVTDPVYVKRILDAHRNGVPAVNIHCAMHSYRWGNFKEAVKLGEDNAGWYEMIGIQSTGHGPQSPIDIKYTDKEHAISKGLADWTTINEELYNNVQVFDSAHALASGHQIQMPRKKKGEPADPNAKGTEAESVVVWTNEFGPKKTRIFSTTIGHNNETVADDRYLDLVTRGLLWVSGHLKDDGTAADGFGK
ncbi:MAG: ThuA domain-containing protein [Verrucomicrobiae bacterium]|nr:ThuA domain-containing protein [Verrucomicrobiae bacterium]